MPVNLVSAGGGTTTLTPASSASNYTVTLPAGTGTVAVNGVSSSIVSGTAVSPTSGSTVDFTGIPSWVKRITINFAAVSANGGSGPLFVQLGTSSGVTTTGYNAFGARVNSASAAAYTAPTTYFYMVSLNAASDAISGVCTITNLTGNTWCAMSVCGDASMIGYGSGSISLAATLDRVRISTSSPDTFDAGSINILYE